MKHRRLLWALAGFAALTALAVYLLHGKVLAVVLILYGYFAVRTIVADRIRSQDDSLRDETSQSETPRRDTESDSGIV